MEESESENESEDEIEERPRYKRRNIVDLELSDEMNNCDLNYRDDLSDLTVLTYNTHSSFREALRKIFFKQCASRGERLSSYSYDETFPDIILLQEISIPIEKELGFVKDSEGNSINITISDDESFPSSSNIKIFELEIKLKMRKSISPLILKYFGYFVLIRKQDEELSKNIITLLRLETDKFIINDTNVYYTHRYCTFQKMCKGEDFTCTSSLGYDLKCFKEYEDDPTNFIRGILIVPIIYLGKKYGEEYTKEIYIVNLHNTHNRKEEIFCRYLKHILKLGKSFIFGGDMNINLIDFSKKPIFGSLRKVKIHKTKSKTIGSGSVLDWFATSCDIVKTKIVQQYPRMTIGTTEDHNKVILNLKINDRYDYDYRSDIELITNHIRNISKEDNEFQRFLRTIQNGTCIIEDRTNSLKNFLSRMKSEYKINNMTFKQLINYCQEFYIVGYSNITKVQDLKDYVINNQRQIIQYYQLCNSGEL